MDFAYNEAQTLLIDTLDRFLGNKYTVAMRDDIAKSSVGYSRPIWQELASLGVIGALFPEAEGGYGGSAFDIVAVFECLGRGLMLEPFLSVLLTGRALAHTHYARREHWLATMLAGESLIAFAHDEAGAHYTLSHVQTRAHFDGAQWILNGVKSAVLHGEGADHYLVSARTGGGLADEEGISLFLVPAAVAGIAVSGFATFDGGRAAELTLTNVRVPGDALVGEKDCGIAIIEHAVGAAILALCAEALGAMEKAKSATLDYLRSRKQFGQPIGRFQALQHRMVTLLLEIEQARSSVINAAASLNDSRVARTRALSAAKYTIGRIGALVAEEVIQLHGAIGMTWDLPVTHYAKRLVMIDHQLGDQDYHLERYIEISRD